MRTLKFGIALLAGASLLLLAGGTPEAFHSGGVAECGGCHSMHSPKPGGQYLLVGTDGASTCLSCHMHAGDTSERIGTVFKENLIWAASYCPVPAGAGIYIRGRCNNAPDTVYNAVAIGIGG